MLTSRSSLSRACPRPAVARGLKQAEQGVGSVPLDLKPMDVAFRV